MKLEFCLRDFPQNIQISNVMKIPPVEADMTKLTVATRNFANAPKGGGGGEEKWGKKKEKRGKRKEKQR